MTNCDAIARSSSTQHTQQSYYTAKSHAPEAKADAALKPPMQKALQKLYTTASLNYDACFGIGSPTSRGNQVVRAHAAIANLTSAIDAVVKAPVANTPATAAFRQCLSALKPRQAYIADASARTQAIHITGSGLNHSPSMMSIMQTLFEAAGMGRLSEFRDTTNLSAKQL